MIPKIAADTIVILDLLGETVPFYEDMAKIATMAEKSLNPLNTSPARAPVV